MAIEADEIVEEFMNSIGMHELKFNKLIDRQHLQFNY